MFKKNKKGVFGLTAVQTFFAVVLGLALLAYVIVIIMGTLGGTAIIPTISYSVVNESNAKATTAGITLACESRTRCGCSAITAVFNGTGGVAIALANFTQVGCLVTNASTMAPWGTNLLYSYPYAASSTSQNNLDSILLNTSTGITGFFSNITPVYAILAILVIILILVVLVRVVQGGSPTGSREQL